MGFLIFAKKSKNHTTFCNISPPRPPKPFRPHQRYICGSINFLSKKITNREYTGIR